MSRQLANTKLPVYKAADKTTGDRVPDRVLVQHVAMRRLGWQPEHPAGIWSSGRVIVGCAERYWVEVSTGMCTHPPPCFTGTGGRRAYRTHSHSIQFS